jgi:uncharacterized membrane protein
MTIGPLQLLLVKFAGEGRMRPISDEIMAVRKSGLIRLVDLIFINKDMDGALHEKQYTDLAEAQKAEYGLILRGLLGMRAAYKTAGEVDKITESMSLSPGDFGMTSEQVQQVASGLPNGGSAILTLFEHVWAVKLKEALLNAGGELVAQGLLSPETLALGGTTLEEAVAAAQKIEAEAEQGVAAQVAEADQKLAEANAEAAAKLAEAQRVLDEAEAQVAERMEQAKLVAAAAIAASVRTAAQEMQEADAQAEQAKREAEELRAQSRRDAAATVGLGAKLASGEVQTGKKIAEETIEEGIQTAEEIKAAAVTEALMILVEAQLIKREATRQAVDMLVSASLIQQAAAEESFARLSAATPGSSGV